MRDFPVFATDNGIGSLTLKEIPYSGIAYILIRDASEPEAFLAECVDFCRMAGAQRILASGHEILSQYPFHTQIWKLRADRHSLPQTDAALFPVTEETAEHWQQLYNQKMKNVPNSAYMSLKDRKLLIQKGGGYFVHADGQLMGLGKISPGQIDAVISLRKGAGEQIVSALAQALGTDTVTLEVASTNEKALDLYTRLGFIKTQVLSTWHQVY